MENLSSILLLVRRHLSTLFFTVGALVLAYVGITYLGMYREQSRLEKEWQRQQNQLQSRPAVSPDLAETTLTKLVIPKISLSAIIVEGTDRKALLRGLGHLAGSSIPGARGNAVLTAHRDTFFRHIIDLNNGDRLLVQRNGKTFLYEVVGKSVVEPTAINVVKQTPDDRLTLITCYPTYYVGPAPQRLVVTGKLVGEPDLTVSESSVQTPTPSILPGDQASAR